MPAGKAETHEGTQIQIMLVQIRVTGLQMIDDSGVLLIDDVLQIVECILGVRIHGHVSFERTNEIRRFDHRQLFDQLMQSGQPLIDGLAHLRFPLVGTIFSCG